MLRQQLDTRFRSLRPRAAALGVLAARPLAAPRMPLYKRMCEKCHEPTLADYSITSSPPAPRPADQNSVAPLRARRCSTLDCHSVRVGAEGATTLYAVIGRRMPLRVSSPTGWTFMLSSTAIKTRGLIRI